MLGLRSAERYGGFLAHRPGLSAVLLGLTLGTLAALLWWALSEGRSRRLQLETEVIAGQVGHRLEFLVESKLAAMGYFADRWPTDFAHDMEAYRADVLHLLGRHPGFRALNWVDDEGVIRTVVPMAGNEAALGRSLHDHPAPSVRAAIERARLTGLPARTDATISFFQGGRGFAVYWPVTGESGALHGFLNGVFEVETCVDLCLPEASLRERFRFGLFEHVESAVDVRLVEGDPADWPHVVSRDVRVVDVPWKLRIAPTDSVLAQEGPLLHGTALVGVEGLVLLVSSLFYVSLRRRRSLRQTQQRVVDLLESTFEGIYGLDPEGRCTFSNPSCRRMLGYDQSDELLGEDMHLLVHHPPGESSDCQAGLCDVGRALRGAEHLHADGVLMWRKDGSSFPVQIHSVPVSQDGTVTGAVVTFIDVSERMESETRLHRLKAILDSTPDFVGMVNADRKTDYINPAGRLMLGWGVDEDLSKKGPPDFHSAAENERMQREVFPVAEREGSWRGETVFLHRDGSEVITSQVLLSHRDGESGPVYFSTIARDVTEKKRLEERVRAAQRLESLSVLAGGVAHDFNNLLVGIIGNASLAREEAPQEPALLESLEAIEVAGRRAAELTEQLLAHAGKAPVERSVFDLNALVAEMSRLMEVSVRKRAKLDVALRETACPVEGDMTQVRQVVMNLIVNASEAVASKGGRIELEVGRMTVGVEGLDAACPSGELPAGEYVFVEVRDNGCGIPEETRQRVFEPFFSTKGTGRGLGLAAALGIVGAHGGGLRLEGGPGEGTRARLLMPVSPTPLKAVVPCQAPAGEARSRRGCILVIDDEELVLDLLVRLLENSGFEALAAEGGRQGLELFAENRERIRAVILDKEMPELDGAETLERLKSLDPEVRVLFSTGYSTDDDMTRVLSLASGFLQKPFGGEELLAALDSVLAPAPGEGQEGVVSGD